jgi:RNA polymerase sigma factor (sigma-70 family)
VTPYAERLALALAYHWWRWVLREPTLTLDEVVDRVKQGRLAYGRSRRDVLYEVILAEAFCRRNEAAARIFMEQYEPIIRRTLRKIGGPRAEQEASDLLPELFLPREGRPPKMKFFEGRTPLANWLLAVARNSWFTRLRRAGPTREWAHEPPEGRDQVTQSWLAEDQECLELLRPLFHRAARALTSDDLLMLRLVLLEQVPQSQVARIYGVNKSTVTRRIRRTTQKFSGLVREVLSALGLEKKGKECLDQLVSGSPEARRQVADSLAEAVSGAAGAVISSPGEPER